MIIHGGGQVECMEWCVWSKISFSSM